MLDLDKKQLPYSQGLHWPSRVSLQPNSQSYIHREREMPRRPIKPPQGHVSKASSCFQAALEGREALPPQQNRLCCPARPPLPPYRLPAAMKANPFLD